MVKSFKQFSEKKEPTIGKYPKLSHYLDGATYGDDIGLSRVKKHLAKATPADHEIYSKAEHAIVNHHKWSNDQASDEGERHYDHYNDAQNSDEHANTSGEKLTKITSKQLGHHEHLAHAVNHFVKGIY